MMVIDEATWKKNRERAMINEPEQKAVVFFSKGKEDLIISASYEGPTSNFAWVIPVPARPKVEILGGAIFHELAKLVQPVPLMMKSTPGAPPAADKTVTLLERKTVGAYDVSVLSATDGKALMKWLDSNKYHLPERAIKPINWYVSQRWTFVACRIKVPGAASGLRSGTLAPLRLTFAAKRPVYPIRLSYANPKAFSLLIYVIVPTSESSGRFNTLRAVSAPVWYANTSWVATLNRGQSRYPTLAKLSRDELQVYEQDNDNFNWFDCDRDYVWDLPGRGEATRRRANVGSKLVSSDRPAFPLAGARDLSPEFPGVPKDARAVYHP
jgi:hypothetical protein